MFFIWVYFRDSGDFFLNLVMGFISFFVSFIEVCGLLIIDKYIDFILVERRRLRV